MLWSVEIYPLSLEAVLKAGYWEIRSLLWKEGLEKGKVSIFV